MLLNFNELGYKRFILIGHSYGCNKLIYYYYKKQPNILGLILASAPDMVGLQLYRQKDYKELIKEAKENIDDGNPTKLLSNLVEDYMYMSSQTYYNWFEKNSNLDNCYTLFCKNIRQIFTMLSSSYVFV